MGSNIARKKDQLWSVDGLGFPPGYFFTAASGGDVTAEAKKVYDGGKITPDILPVKATKGDLTLIALYRPADLAGVFVELERKLLAGIQVECTPKQLDCDADKTPIGVVRTYAGSRLIGLKWPEHDSNDDAEARAELTFAMPQ